MPARAWEPANSPYAPPIKDISYGGTARPGTAGSRLPGGRPPALRTLVNAPPEVKVAAAATASAAIRHMSPASGGAAAKLLKKSA